MAYSPFRHISSVFWKKKPIHLTLFLTRRCNARCSFCFYLSDENVTHGNESELSLDELKKIAASMDRLLWLAFSGGEIFLRKDIVDITKAFYNINKPSIILFPTNGLLTDTIKDAIEQIVSTCKNSTIVVKLSLDGTEKVHDELRGDGSFSKTMQTFNALKGLLNIYPNLDLGINTVFCSANQDSMEEIIDHVSSMKMINTHTVSLIRGAVTDESLKDVDMKKYFNAINRLARDLQTKVSSIYRFRGAKIKAAQDILQREIIYNTFMQQKQLIPCYAGRLNLVLRETGDVYPCESFNLDIGNIRDFGHNMKKLLASERAFKIITSINEKKCYCTHECYTMTNILFNFRLYPSLLRQYKSL